MAISKQEKLAEIVGLCFSDGSLTNKNGRIRFQLRGNRTEDRRHYDEFVIPLFNQYIGKTILKRKISIVESKNKNKSYGIAIESKRVGNFLVSLGIPRGKKKNF